MNILIISATYHPSINGVAISTERSIKSLKKQGHKVYAIVPGEEMNLQGKGTKNFFFIPSLPNYFNDNYRIAVPHLSRELKKWLKDKKIDIIHVHHPMGVSSLAKKIAKLENCPLVFTYHTRYDEYAGLYLGKVGKKYVDTVVTNFCNNHCDGIIATTESFQKELSDKFTTPVYYSSTAGLMKTMKHDKSKDVIRKLLKLPTDKILLLNVSRHAAEKNLKLLLKKMKKLDGKKYHLLMVGDGPHKNELVKIAKKLGVSKKVTFIGFVDQDDLDVYYSSADAFMYSSKTDTIGINILEAMSAGLPVIAVDDPSTAEVVKHKKNGYLLDSDADSFAHHVKMLFSKEETIKEFGKNAEKMAKKFMIEETSKRLAEVYKKVI